MASGDSAVCYSCQRMCYWGTWMGKSAMFDMDFSPVTKSHSIKTTRLHFYLEMQPDGSKKRVTPSESSCTETPVQSGGISLSADQLANAKVANVTQGNIQVADDKATKALDVAISVATQFGLLGEKVTNQVTELASEHAKLDAKWQAILEAQKTTVVEVKMPSGIKHDLGMVHKNFAEFLDLVIETQGMGIPFMIGEPGSMKTSVLPLVARALSETEEPLPYYVMSMNNQTSRSEMLGFMSGHGDYVDTPVYKVVKFGGVLLIDEIDASNANGITGMNVAATNAFVGFPNGETVVKHRQCYIIAAGNTTGSGAIPMYQARNQLDMATRTRFIYQEWNTDWNLVGAIVRGIMGTDLWARKVKMLHDTLERRGIQFVVSSRVALVGAKLLASGKFTEAQCLDRLVWPNLSEDERRNVEGELRS